MDIYFPMKYFVSVADCITNFHVAQNLFPTWNQKVVIWQMANDDDDDNQTSGS